MTAAPLVIQADVARRRASIEAADVDLSDDGIALRFADRYADTLRYTAEHGHWSVWVGARWRRDNTLKVLTYAREICREVADIVRARPKSKAMADSIASARTVASVVSLARADVRLAVTSDQWDRDPYLLGTPEGTVNLRTAGMQPASPDDYITRQTAVTPGGTCPRWLGFLGWATDGNRQILEYLQRATGYWLTGDTLEQKLWFFYGPGGNGKGTFINTITRIMNDYATVAPMEVFTEARGERHPTELAMLRGARLVTAQETEKNRRWAESRVKAITGGDPITARYMRGDFFTYQPQFKLVGGGNHKPALASVDEAMRRRFNLVPFERIISEADKDLELSTKLRGEWPGILKWMIEGAVEWHRNGLQTPQCVLAATNAYLVSEDNFGAWLEECCSPSASGWASSADLYASWTAWATRTGEDTGSQRAMSDELKKRGFEPQKQGHSKVRGYAGLEIMENTANAYHTR